MMQNCALTVVASAVSQKITLSNSNIIILWIERAICQEFEKSKFDFWIWVRWPLEYWNVRAFKWKICGFFKVLDCFERKMRQIRMKLLKSQTFNSLHLRKHKDRAKERKKHWRHIRFVGIYFYWFVELIPKSIIHKVY